MKKKTKTLLIHIFYLFIITLVVIFAILFVHYNPKIKKIPVEVKVPVIQNRYIQRHPPEFRNPPIKTYEPKNIQQIGVLLGSDEQIFPLYGKKTKSYRNRYNYYTTVGNNNLYSIPVLYKNKDCMETIGCDELFDKDKVNILGKNGEYDVNIYKNVF